MKKLILLFLFSAYQLFAVESKYKNYFFVFTSDIPYKIISNDEECLKIDNKYSQNKKVFQKAIYFQVKNTQYCLNSEKKIIISYSNNKNYVIPFKDKYPSLSDIKKINSSDSVYSMITPAGVLLIEINKNKVKRNIPAPVNGNGSKYKITFPWMCLEFCSGDANEELNEVINHKEVLTSASYERYTVDGGNWRILNTTDVTRDLLNEDLAAWPMIRSNSRNMNENEMEENINSIWDNREVLAQTIVNEAINNNYEGYCLDIEFQTSRASTRDKYIQLVDFLADKLHENGKKLMVAHAHWATMAPMSYLKNTSVDYVATMDPYTASELFFRKDGDETRGQAYEDYNQIEHNRLIWAFAWENHVKSTQEGMWQWLQANGYNEGVAGAAVWRVPAVNSCKSGCNPSTQGINYYDAFEEYYPIDKNNQSGICSNVTCSNHGICEERDGEAFCNCYEGYHSQGMECIKNEENCTPDITCSDHGVCDDSTGIISCICDAGYVNFGTECLKYVSHKKKIIKTLESENFKMSGPMPYFHNENIGLNGNSVWCYQDNKDTQNRFDLTFYGLEPGKYRVFTYIPAKDGLAKYIKYEIKNGVSIKISKLNQTRYKGNWGYLGEFDISENLQISLRCYDLEGDKNTFKRVYFSAVKLELLEDE